MVLYYLLPREDPNDVPAPMLLGTLHYSLKGIQIGLVGGCAAGVLLGMRTVPASIPNIAHKVTQTMLQSAQIGAVGGIFYNFHEMVCRSWPQNRKWAHDMQRSVWHNRIDSLTCAGAVAGAVVLGRVPRLWTQVFGMSEAQASLEFGGAAWGALAGTCLDLPVLLVTDKDAKYSMAWREKTRFHYPDGMEEAEEE